MKNKNIVLIILIVIIAVVGVVFCSTLSMHKNYEDKVNDALSKVKVPVAKKDIAKGEKIDFDFIGVIDIDLDDIPKGEMISFNELANKMANKDIKKGDIIKKSDVSDFIN